jgi:hypothetical protein
VPDTGANRIRGQAPVHAPGWATERDGIDAADNDGRSAHDAFLSQGSVDYE